MIILSCAARCRATYRSHLSPRAMVAVGVALALLACSTHSDSVDTSRYAGLMAFDTATLRLVGRDTTRVTAELAESEPQRTMGLMERPSLRPEAGMLFLYPTVQPDSSAFWMFRTRIPLDIAFIDSSGIIRSMFTMQPCPSPLARGCPDYPANARYLAALEVTAGFFSAHGLRVGDHLLLSDTLPRRGATASVAAPVARE